MQQSLYSRLNFFSIIYTNTIKLSYLGFFQQHLWVLLHIQHDKPDKTTLKQHTAWVQRDQDKCTVNRMPKCDRTLADFPSAKCHNCVNLNQLTQMDTGDEGLYPVFPLAHPQPHSAFELVQQHSHINVHLFICHWTTRQTCLCLHLSSNRA